MRNVTLLTGTVLPFTFIVATVLPPTVGGGHVRASAGAQPTRLASTAVIATMITRLMGSSRLLGE